MRAQGDFSNQAYVGLNNQMGLGSQQTVTNSNALRNQIQNKYTNSNNFMPDGIKPNANGFFSLPPGSQASTAQSGMGNYGSAREGYEKLAANGGVNRGDFDKALQGYEGMMSNGGIDAQALRARGGTTMPAFYDQYKAQSQRRANTQGGYSPGFDSQQAELARQAGREGFNANRVLEGDIADKQQQGRQFGISGYGNLQRDITGMEQGGKIAGLGGLRGMGDSETQNNQFNTGQTNSMNQFNTGQANDMQMQMQDRYQRGGMASADGLQGLYSSAPGDVGQMYQQRLQGLSGNANSNQGYWNTIYGNQQGGSKWAGIANAAVGAYSAYNSRNKGQSSTRQY